MAKKSVGQSSERGAGAPDPRETIIIVGEDGKLYKLNGDDWRDFPMPDSGARGIIDQLTQFGSLLAFIPPDIAVGIGTLCTVVNLKGILKGNPKGGVAAEAGVQGDAPYPPPGLAEESLSTVAEALSARTIERARKE
jgi:hypothetical protein